MRTQKRWGSFVTSVLICVVSIVLTWCPAGAISEEDLERKIKVIRGLTKQKALDSLEEKRQIAIAEKMYKDEQKAENLSAIGQLYLDGLFPTEFLPLGALATLTFQFVDPATDQPTPGPPVAFVEYLVNLDPDNDIFFSLGNSADAASHFSLAFTVVPFEPFIRSIPFDSNGDPIFIAGVEGQNVAISVGVILEPVPEPSTIVLVGIGGVVCLGYAWRRRRRAVA